MPIDTTIPGTPGFIMKTLANRLAADRPRLQRLEDYWLGQPKMPAGAEAWTASFQAFIRTSRSNFAAAIVQAPRDRLSVRTFYTAATGDDNGDPEAMAHFTENDLGNFQSDLYRLAFTMSRGYVSVGQTVDATTKAKVAYATVEDPREFITQQDPLRPQITRQGLKLWHDPIGRRDFAFLWLPGELYVAVRQLKMARSAPPQPYGYTGPPPPILVTFSSAGYDWVGPMGDDGTYAPGTDETGQPVPFQTYDGDPTVTLFENRDGVGEFELHLDLLDRINHMILQRLVIATMQAFRQRAIEQPADGQDLLPMKDDAGNTIDYDDIFKASPSALWKLPPGAKIWESQQADIQSILAATKDDVLHLAGITQTPMSQFSPDAIAQSAEGAALTKEGQTFKVTDRQSIFGPRWARVMAHLFQASGNKAKAKVSDITVGWAPAERFSLAEKASADSLATSLPDVTKWAIIWQMTPDEIMRAISAKQDQLVLEQTMALQAAQAQAAINPPAAPADPGAPSPAPGGALGKRPAPNAPGRPRNGAPPPGKAAPSVAGRNNQPAIAK